MGLVTVCTSMALIGTTSCGYSGLDEGGDRKAGVEDPVIGYAVGPIKFSISTRGKISIALGARWVTPVGTFSIDEGVDSSKKTAGNELIVVIRHTEDGTVKESVFRVAAAKGLRVTMEGRVVQEFSPGRVLIEADPGTGITIDSTGGSANPGADPSGGTRPSARASTSPTASGGTRPATSPRTSASSRTSGSPQPTAHRLPTDFAAGWRGSALSTSTYTVALRLQVGQPGTIVGESDYPGINCSGTLTLETEDRAAVRTDRIVLREDIVRDPKQVCTRRGWIVLGKAPGGKLKYDYYTAFPNTGNAVVHSAGLLTRGTASN
ncbi:hypothetical protein OG948_41315 (plasmid) [Embleya sp. NBC_00888]|uniref:hypothetical protein n=1 Tax=Embleya sp. NBC_00888 TaxID=2975960 RepID=UPI00386D6768|nr:hypothetical protein OG948_41315 [Embleya sp. NBC_00888]